MAALGWSAEEIAVGCACLGLRRAARLVTRRYDEALRPAGLTSGQFSILAALLGETALRLGALADRLGMDRTTLNRNLRPLERLDLLQTVADAADRRARALTLTSAGLRRLRAALPMWEEAHADSTRRLFGKAGWSALKAQLDRLAE